MNFQLKVLLLSFVVSVILGAIIIPILRKLKVGQIERTDGPQSHLQKQGTPTMGGIIMALTMLLISGFLYWEYMKTEPDVATRMIPLVFVTLGFGLVGFVDDFKKLVLKNTEGLKPAYKMIGLLIIAVAYTLYLVKYLNIGTETYIPILKEYITLPIWLYIPFAIFVLLGTTNAVNLTDGIDGLSTSVTTIILTCLVSIGIILGIKEGNIGLALSTNTTKESKILTNRNVIKRAKTLMPYLLYDEEPYLVVNKEGKLVWVIDAYTTSSEYPYSQMSTIQTDLLTKLDINYIRNSVKVLIDAYDGTTKFYITDRADPIIMSYRNIYPSLFVDKDEQIEEDIKNQFIYPKFLYKIQANIITRYHNIQPDVLYRGDDIWEIATNVTGKTTSKTGTEIEPYYTMVKTIDSENAQLGLVIPYTPYKKQNIISYTVGTYENGTPKLTIYKYASDSNAIGTMQLNSLTEQDENIYREIEKLKVTGTKITKNTIVVPIENTLLYVQSIYQQYTNEDNSLPLLKKVVVASGNKFAIGNNIEEAINNLLSQSAFDIEIESTETIEETIKAIIKANENLEKSNNSNDWEMIGKDMKKLQELIKKLDLLVKNNKE